MSTPAHPEPAAKPLSANDEMAAPGRDTSQPVAAEASTVPASAQSAGDHPAESRIPKPSLIGTKFDDFEILSELGRGGMGVVYKARQLSLDRFVALKLLLAEHCHNDKVLKRFLSEARTAAALEHPNIVKVYQVGECMHGHYFAMEYIDGPCLQTVIHRKPMRPSSAVALMILVAEAVHYAHTKGIIHRDLKPANIMLDPKKRPVVMDFGIAKYLDQPSSLTQHGAIIGTPGYMPPEQAGDSVGKMGPHSDVYALGAILYSLLAGRPPYDEETSLKTIIKVVSGEPPPPLQKFRGDVAPELEAVCLRCLQKNPSDRYPSAEALAKDLRRLRAGKAPKADKAKSPETAAPREQQDRTPEARCPALLVEQATGKKIPLHFGDTIIGRASDCDIIIRSSDVSKRHCQIQFFPDKGAFVEDLKSINGTTVNGNPIELSPLRHNDKLGVAGHIFRVAFAKP